MLMAFSRRTVLLLELKTGLRVGSPVMGSMDIEKLAEVKNSFGSSSNRVFPSMALPVIVKSI
jgi:hypothetical protein